MTKNDTFTYYHPITIRFSDLDAQGHVNNAVYLSYLENARLGYYQAAGIWQNDGSFITGMVVARNEINYLAPIHLNQTIRVGLRLARMGHKSLTFDFQIDSQLDGSILASGKSVMVAYDPKAKSSIPLPPEWRDKLSQYENLKGEK